MIQGDCPARLLSQFSLTPTLETSKMSSFTMIGDFFQSKQSKLEKSTVYHQDHCSQSLYMHGHSVKHYLYAAPLF